MKVEARQTASDIQAVDRWKTIVRPRSKKARGSRVKLPWLRIINGVPVVVRYENG